MREYRDYIEGVRSGRIVAPIYIKQAVERLERFKSRDDMWFDEEEVQRAFDFFAVFKEYSGKASGQSGALLPFQKWIVGSVIGIKWRSDNTRVCRNMFLMVARKNAKTSLIAKLSLYLMIMDGEDQPYIGCVASSRDQARILFEQACSYLKTIDPEHKAVKEYRNYLKFPSRGGEFKVFASDSSVLDGYNFSCAICDETHSYKDNKLINVLQSSQGARKQPLLIKITTAGFLLEGYPCFEERKVAIEILAGIKEDESYFPFIYQMDPDDDWEDERNWVKCNPAIDVVVDRDYLRRQLLNAKNDSTQTVPVKTKNFNIFCSASSIWLRQEDVATCMCKLDLKDFEGNGCYIGVDLASVSDLTALSVMVPMTDGTFNFWNWGFIPQETYDKSPNRELYRKFYDEGRGNLHITPGNCTDYNYITAVVQQVSQICPVQGVWYDPYNSSTWALQMQELGYEMKPFKQGMLNFNKPTKEMERLVLTGKAKIEKSMLSLWCFGNAVLRMDYNQNVKPEKNSSNSKIDVCISMVQALAGYMENPYLDDLSIFVI